MFKKDDLIILITPIRDKLITYKDPKVPLILKVLDKTKIGAYLLEVHNTSEYGFWYGVSLYIQKDMFWMYNDVAHENFYKIHVTKSKNRLDLCLE